MEKELPKGWVLSDISTVAEIHDNRRKPISAKERAKRIGEVPYYGATGQAGWIDDYLFDEQLVLLGEDGAPFFEEGKDVAYMVEGKSWVNNHAHVLKAKNGVTVNSYLLHYLNYFDYSGYVGGTTRLKLTQGNMKKIPVPLSPLPEQKRIVAKLDALFGHLEVLRNRLDRIPELLKNFRQQVLTQAVTGKLTEEWRKENDPSNSEEIFKAILQRRSQSKKKKVKESAISLRQDLSLFELPETWNWADLGFLMDETDSFCYGVVQPGKQVQKEQKLIRVMDLQNGRILTEQLRGISNEIDKKYKRSRVQPGDLLVSVVGTIGRTALVKNNAAGYNIARAVAKVPAKDVSTEYIKIFIDSWFGQKWLIGDTREVARKTLNLLQLSTLPIPIPSLMEQQVIVKKVNKLFSAADQIEAQYQNLKEKIDQLPQAFLSKAFKGELVAQDVSDEPAEVLLERIKAASAGAASGAKKGKVYRQEERLGMVAEERANYK